MSLNPNAQEWVNDLRSGKFKQAKGRLGNGRGGYCCLGVACLTYQRVTGEKIGDRRLKWRRGGGLDGALSEIREWLGLFDSEGEYVGYEGKMKALASDNDEGKAFTEIADIIESEPEGLFV